MARQARQKSKSDIYHIILKGINEQVIFEDKEDNVKFIETLIKYKEISGYKIFAFCLMGNHLHLLLKTDKDGLDVIIKRIAGSYVYWYNWKYNRSGHLFQDRYKSEVVENDSYLLTVLRYIHLNPVKAGLCKKPEIYEYCSYNDYIKGKSELVDILFIQSIINENDFIVFHKNNDDQHVMDDKNTKTRLNDSEATAIIIEIAECKHSSEVQTYEIERRNKIIKILNKQGLSIRQLSRLTGISKGIIERNL